MSGFRHCAWSHQDGRLLEQQMMCWAPSTDSLLSSCTDARFTTGCCGYLEEKSIVSNSCPSQFYPDATDRLQGEQLMQPDPVQQQCLPCRCQQTPISMSACLQGSSIQETASFNVLSAAGRSRLGKPTAPTAGQGASAAAAACLDQVNTGNCVPKVAIAGVHEGLRSMPGGDTNPSGDAVRCSSGDEAQECTAGKWSPAAENQCGRQVRIHCVTFNMGNKVPPNIPPELLGYSQVNSKNHSSTSPETEVDLYVFATQENGSITDWEHIIGSSLPAGYVRLARQTLRAIHLVLYASGRFQQQVLTVRGSAVATGIGNLVGNKGAVALAVQLVDMKLLFISSHFAAHDDKVERRNADFARIKAGLFSGSSSYNSLADLTSHASSNSGGHNQERTCGTSTLQHSWPRPSWRRSTGNSWCGSAPQSASSQQRCHQLKIIPLLATCPAVASPRGWCLGAWRRCSASISPLNNGIDVHPAVDTHDQPSQPSSLQQSETGISKEFHILQAAAASTRSYSLQICDTEQQQGHRVRLLSAGSIACDSQYSPKESASGNSLPDSPCAWVTATSGTALEHESSNLLSLQNRLQQSTGTQNIPDGSGDVTVDHDVVFWLGDLNYRINGNTRSVGYLLRSKLHEVLHANDQLRLQQKKGHVFQILLTTGDATQGFQEGKIKFPPTFKFVPGTSQYSDQRVPSWTDRILWKIRSREAGSSNAALTINQIRYDSVPAVSCSDHKPVVASFDLVVAAAKSPSFHSHGNTDDLKKGCIIM